MPLTQRNEELLATLKVSAPDIQPEGFKTLQDEVDGHIKDRRKILDRLAEAQAELGKLQRKLKHLPKDRELKAMHKALVIESTDLKDESDDLTKLIDQLQLKLHETVMKKQRAEIEAESREDSQQFIIPDSDPLVRAQILSAIAENLQYQLVSGKKWYRNLINQVTKRQDSGETLDTDAVNPEISNSKIDQLDALRVKRRYIQVLRLSVERAFYKAMEDLPENAPFRPKLMRRSDEELEAWLESRAAGRRQAAQAQRDEVAAASQRLADAEDGLYVACIKPA